MTPRDPDDLFTSAVAHHQAGNLDAAEAMYRAALRSHPEHVNSLTNLGTLEIQRGHYEAGVRLIDRSLGINPDQPHALNNRGNAVRNLDRLDEALADYERALALRPDYVDARLNRANVLRELGRHRQALAEYEHLVSLRPGEPDLWITRGNLEQLLGQFPAALASFECAIALSPDSSGAHVSRGNVLSNMGRDEEALASYRRGYVLDPHIDFLIGNCLHGRMQLCDWGGIENDFRSVRDGVDRGDPVCIPFHFLGIPASAAQQRRCAEIYAARCLPPASPRPARRTGPAHRRIRLGYFSADFRNHPGAHLIAGLIEQHDRRDFEVYGFSYGPDTGDPMRRRLERAFDHFLDVRSRPDEEIVALAREHEIDIAIDRNGYTAYLRTGIFARRPAPIQTAYLGFPGTTGAPWMDYLIADPVVIPAEHFRHYTEQVVWLPHCYQPNDATRAISERPFTREELGLPERGFVFCCFNNNYKITPDVFDLWMRLLERVEGSVLWLLEGNAAAARNLRAEAATRGIAPGRLVFAGRVEMSEHLGRHRLADLFLDTLHYGAHTTASDALWAGLPVVTCLGETFPARVAASLLTAIGLPELITASPADYEALAVELAMDPAKHQELKKKLAAHRTTYPLFDTVRYTRHLEAAYRQMWQRYRDGLAPEHIRIATP